MAASRKTTPQEPTLPSGASYDGDLEAAGLDLETPRTPTMDDARPVSLTDFNQSVMLQKQARLVRARDTIQTIDTKQRELRKQRREAEKEFQAALYTLGTEAT